MNSRTAVHSDAGVRSVRWHQIRQVRITKKLHARSARGYPKPWFVKGTRCLLHSCSLVQLFTWIL